MSRDTFPTSALLAPYDNCDMINDSLHSADAFQSRSVLLILFDNPVEALAIVTSTISPVYHTALLANYVVFCRLSSLCFGARPAPPMGSTYPGQGRIEVAPGHGDQTVPSSLEQNNSAGGGGGEGMKCWGGPLSYWKWTDRQAGRAGQASLKGREIEHEIIGSIWHDGGRQNKPGREYDVPRLTYASCWRGRESPFSSPHTHYAAMETETATRGGARPLGSAENQAEASSSGCNCNSSRKTMPIMPGGWDSWEGYSCYCAALTLNDDHYQWRARARRDNCHSQTRAHDGSIIPKESTAKPSFAWFDGRPRGTMIQRRHTTH